MTLEHHFVVSVRDGVVAIDHETTDIKFEEMRIYNHKTEGWDSVEEHPRASQKAQELLEKIIVSSWSLPCDTCGTPVDKDIHKEELGFCVDCQHEYFKEN